MGASARRAGLSPTLVMLLYLAGQCASFCTHIPPLDQWNSEGFSPSSCGRILSLPEFQIQDLSPLASPAGSSEKESVVVEPSPFEIFSLQALGLESAAQAKNFLVFGCGWWYDREIVLLPPLCEYRERLRERLPGNSASGPHSSRRVQAPSRP